MEKRRIGRAILLVGVWAYAAATWASIAHHLMGLPDVVFPAALAAAAGATVWSVRRSPNPREPARSPSRAGLLTK